MYSVDYIPNYDFENCQCLQEMQSHILDAYATLKTTKAYFKQRGTPNSPNLCKLCLCYLHGLTVVDFRTRKSVLLVKNRFYS